ncbi:MAG TPA: LysR family transcriptional regulator [Hyphomicrobiaceae bacterium]|nr:LysR family transcriptional regulator [Hyphomicrobiaceae bacterium]
MVRDIDISLLRAFLAVVDTGSVTGAARLLNRTQAAVSQQLKRLEESLGTPLFEREHKRVTLNSEGERLVAKARKLVSLNDETWGLMTTPQYNGTVRLGIPCDIVSTYAPPILRRFAQAWPHVQVSLICDNTNDLIRGLENGDLDLTLTTETTCPDHAECLRWDHLVWATAHDSDVSNRRPLPLAVGSPDCRFRPVVLDVLRKHSLDWRFVMEVSSEDATNAAVEAGLAVKPILRDSVPPGLKVLDETSGLPDLPAFGINLYLPRTSAQHHSDADPDRSAYGSGNELANELANHIRADFSARFGPSNSHPGAPLELRLAEATT